MLRQHAVLDGVIEDVLVHIDKRLRSGDHVEILCGHAGHERVQARRILHGIEPLLVVARPRFGTATQGFGDGFFTGHFTPLLEHLTGRRNVAVDMLRKAHGTSGERLRGVVANRDAKRRQPFGDCDAGFPRRQDIKTHPCGTRYAAATENVAGVLQAGGYGEDRAAVIPLV